MEQPHFIRVEPNSGVNEFCTEITVSNQLNKSNAVSNRDIIGLLSEQKELEIEQKFIIEQATNRNFGNDNSLLDFDEPP